MGALILTPVLVDVPVVSRGFKSCFFHLACGPFSVTGRGSRPPPSSLSYSDAGAARGSQRERNSSIVLAQD